MPEEASVVHAGFSAMSPGDAVLKLESGYLKDYLHNASLVHWPGVPNSKHTKPSLSSNGH